jgi:hypothetical protein
VSQPPEGTSAQNPSRAKGAVPAGEKDADAASDASINEACRIPSIGESLGAIATQWKRPREREQSQQGETSGSRLLRLRPTGGQHNEAAVCAIFPEPTVIDGMPYGCLEFFRCSPRLCKSTD